MTSTPFNIGLRDGQRSSSRVLRPPGGGHTDIFGTTREPESSRNMAESIPESTIEEPKDHPTEKTNGASHPEIKVDKMGEASSVEAVKEEQVKLQPESLSAGTLAAAEQAGPRRTRVPPGGFSSGLW